MILGRIVGSVVSTIHHRIVDSRKLLLAERLDESGIQRRQRRRWTRRLSSIAAALLLGTIGTGAWMLISRTFS